MIANNYNNTTEVDYNKGGIQSVGQPDTNADTTDIGNMMAKHTNLEVEMIPQKETEVQFPFKDILSMERVFQITSWDMAAIKTFDLFDMIQSVDQLETIFKQAEFKKYAVTMFVDAVAPTTVSGAFAFGFTPHNTTSPVAKNSFTAADLTGCKHVVMDLQGNRSATFASTWSAQNQFAHASGNQGFFFLAPLTPLRSTATGTQVDLSIRFWIHDFEFDVPKAQGSNVEAFSMNPPACFGAAPYKASDDYGVDTIWKRPTLHEVFEWNVDDGRTSTIGTIDLDAGDKSSAAWVASHLKEKCGTAHVQLMAVKTAYHSGKIDVHYAAQTPTGGQTTYKVVWDLNTSSTLDLVIPTRETTFLVTDLTNKVILRNNYGLKAPDAVESTIDILAYVHYSDLRGSALDTLAQGYTLQPENEIRLGPKTMPKHSGFTLSELVEQWFTLGQIPASNLGFDTLLVSPNAVEPNRVLPAASPAVNAKKLNSPPDILGGFFMFVDGAPKVSVRFGPKKMALPISGGAQTLLRNTFEPYDGIVAIRRNQSATSTEGSGCIPISSAANGTWNEVASRAVRTGDTLLMDVPGFSNRWNHERTNSSGVWALTFAAVHEDDATANPITYFAGLPALAVRREMPKFYGMFSRTPKF